MRKINPKLRAELAADPWMQECCYYDKSKCQGRVQYHHALVYSGRQVSEAFAIVPACEHHHNQVKQDQKTRYYFEFIALVRMTTEDKLKMPKRDWNQELIKAFNLMQL